jgi:hypothetical protein
MVDLSIVFSMFHRMVNRFYHPIEAHKICRKPSILEAHILMVNSLPGFLPGCDDHGGLCYFDQQGGMEEGN